MSIRPTKKPFNWKLVTTAVISAVGLFLWSRMTPTPPRSTEKKVVVPAVETAQPVEAKIEQMSPAEQVPAAVLVQTETPMPPAEGESFGVTFELCFPEQKAGGTNLESHLNGLGPQIEKRETELQNLHWKIGGVEKRLQAAWRPQGQELRFFDVDAEGLPVPVEKPRLMTHAQAEEQKKQMDAKGSRLFEQKKETLHLRGGGRVSVDWRDGKPYDVAFSQSGRSLYCREDRCQCREQKSR